MKTKRRSILKMIAAAPLALLGIRLAKAEQVEKVPHDSPIGIPYWVAPLGSTQYPELGKPFEGQIVVRITCSPELPGHVIARAWGHLPGEQGPDRLVWAGIRSSMGGPLFDLSGYTRCRLESDLTSSQRRELCRVSGPPVLTAW